MSRSIVGARIRAYRREQGVTQAELARRLGISPSYLNLIESSKRAIAGRLLAQVAEELGVGVDALDGAAERRLVDQLQEIAADPRLDGLGVPEEDAGGLIGRFPAWARALAALASSERELAAANRVMSDRLTHDPVLAEAVHRMLTHTAAMRSAAEILRDVPDLGGDDRERFVAILADEAARLSDVGIGLAGYFERAHTAARAVTPSDEVGALFEARANHFAEIEAALADAVADADDPERAARLAGPAVEAILAGAPEIGSEAARGRARRRLMRYAEDALAAPAAPLAAAARATRYDAELAAHRLGVAPEVVFRRLPSLPPAPGAPRFGYLQTNAAGVMTDFLGLPGLAPPRHGAACPLWINFRAAAEPGRTLRQLARFPTGLSFLFVARARRLSEPGFGRSGPHVTDMLVIAEDAARDTVYGARAAGELVPEPVGRSCAICPREPCAHRVADALSV